MCRCLLASISTYVTELLPSPSVGLSIGRSVDLSVGLSGRCTVARRLSGPDAIGDGEWNRSRDGSV